MIPATVNRRSVANVALLTISILGLIALFGCSIPTSSTTPDNAPAVAPALTDAEKSTLQGYAAKIKGYDQEVRLLNNRLKELPSAPLEALNTEESKKFEQVVSDVSQQYTKLYSRYDWIDEAMAADLQDHPMPSNVTATELMARVASDLERPYSAGIFMAAGIRDGLKTLMQGYSTAYSVINVGNDYQAIIDDATVAINGIPNVVNNLDIEGAGSLASQFGQLRERLANLSSSTPSDSSFEDVRHDMRLYANMFSAMEKYFGAVHDNRSTQAQWDAAKASVDISPLSDQSVATQFGKGTVEIIVKAEEDSKKRFDTVTFTNGQLMARMNPVVYPMVGDILIQPEFLSEYTGGMETETGKDMNMY